MFVILLLLFLAVALVLVARRVLSTRKGALPHDASQVPPTKNDDVASHPSNPFTHDDLPEAEQPSIIVQSPIPPKKEFFVMRADSKTASILGGESSDMITRQGEIVDMGDMSQDKSKKTIKE